MNTTKLLLLTVVLSVLAGCSITASVYPIAGPMSEQLPLPVLAAQVHSVHKNTGQIDMMLPSGEKLVGKWSSIAPQSSSATIGALSSTWTTVFGSSFTTANLPGVNRGEAMLVGDRGTVMEVEFFTGSGTANGTGVAKDNQGNYYKVLF